MNTVHAHGFGGALTDTHDHIVHLYGSDDEFELALGPYATTAIRAGGSFLFLARPGHERQLRRVIAAQGVDVGAAQRQGRIAFVDAAHALSGIMAGSLPDEARFRGLVDALMDRAAGPRGTRPVHVFGELVDLLWHQGNEAATLRLEELWNDLQRGRPFTLHCAFRTDPSRTDLSGTFGRILREHRTIVRSRTVSETRSRGTHPPVGPNAPAAAESDARRR